MESMKRLMLGVVGVLSLVATTSVPVFAVDASALKDSAALNNKTLYQDYADKLYKNTDTTQTVQASSLRFGWNVLQSGSPDKIMYKDENGNIIKNQWYKPVGEGWHYFDTEGYMKRSAWVQDNGKYYYLEADGDMATDIVVDGCYLNASGAYDSSVTDFSGKRVYKGVALEVGVISASDFESKVASGEIKAKVAYWGSTAKTTDSSTHPEIGSGTIDFYLTK